jgi:hypothetical protein
MTRCFGGNYTRRDVVRSDDGVIALADAYNPSLPWLPGGDLFYAGRFATRHGRDASRINVTFRDGHMETLDWDIKRLCRNLMPWSAPGQ